METALQNNTEISDQNSLSGVQASHALVTNIEFSSGKKSSIVTLFNCSDFSFEEINIGVNTGLNRQDWLDIINKKSILYKFVNGKIEKSVEFMRSNK